MSAQRSREPRPVSELLLAGLGLAGLSVEVADELADDVARRPGVERDTVRDAVRDTFASRRASESGAERPRYPEQSRSSFGVN